MPASIIDGKAVAAELRAQIAADLAALAEPPGLATLLVGDHAASASYVASKRRQCVQAGIRDLHRHLPGDVGQDELAATAGSRASRGFITWRLDGHRTCSTSPSDTGRRR